MKETARTPDASALFGDLKPIARPPQAGAVLLYPGDAPGSDAAFHAENWQTQRGELWVRNVTVPTLTPVLPDAGKGNGAAVIVAPGGAFRALAIENEGVSVARWLADHGIAAFILKYRLIETVADLHAFEAEIGTLLAAFVSGQGTPEDLAAPPDALADGQQAVRLIRTRAAEWNVDSARVGFIGFSAGAITAIAVATKSPADARPDFIAPIYPSMNVVDVPVDAPPMFVVLASDDPLFGGQGFGLVESWRQARRPVELHYYERGGHGFGMHRQGVTIDGWANALHSWLTMHGWVPTRQSVSFTSGD